MKTILISLFLPLGKFLINKTIEWLNQYFENQKKKEVKKETNKYTEKKRDQIKQAKEFLKDETKRIEAVEKISESWSRK